MAQGLTETAPGARVPSPTLGDRKKRLRITGRNLEISRRLCYHGAMNQTVMRLTDGAAAQSDATPADIPAESVLWIDVEGTLQELEAYPRPAGIPLSTLIKALAQQGMPTATATQDAVMLSLPVRRRWDQEDAAFVTFIMQECRVVTLHAENTYDFDPLREQLEDGGAAVVTDAPSLLLVLFEHLVETSMRSFIDARAKTEELSDRVDRTPRSVQESEIVSVRRKVERLHNQFEDQFYGLADLQALTSHPQLEDATRQKIHDIGDAQNHLLRNLTRLENRLRDLEQQCEYALQQQTALRLRQLTVLSSIFMPLTLVTGIYGMNFHDLPGTTWPYGYYSLMAGMAVVTAVLLYVLKRKGWFD